MISLNINRSLNIFLLSVEQMDRHLPKNVLALNGGHRGGRHQQNHQQPSCHLFAVCAILLLARRFVLVVITILRRDSR